MSSDPTLDSGSAVDQPPAGAGPIADGVLTPTRRAVLAGAGAVAVAILGGCATYDQNAPAADAGPAGDGDDSDTASPDEGQESPAGPKPLAQTGDIPVGGGKVIENKRLVVTQPSKGTFKCFTAVCTHAGCVVSSVEGGTVNCACHGSKFKIADGSVANGPAARPLREVNITVTGNDITLA